jgi:hypothetical protein
MKRQENFIQLRKLNLVYLINCLLFFFQKYSKRKSKEENKFVYCNQSLFLILERLVVLKISPMKFSVKYLIILMVMIFIKHFLTSIFV